MLEIIESNKEINFYDNMKIIEEQKLQVASEIQFLDFLDNFADCQNHSYRGEKYFTT